MASVPSAFRGASCAPEVHDDLLRRVQRLRGRIAVEEGALRSWQLTPDGRDLSPLDVRAWHLLTLESDGTVAGCMRMLVHPENTSFDSLTLSHTSMAACPIRGKLLRSAVHSEIRHASRIGASLVEAGGWVLHESLRRSTAGARLALAVWAWSRLMGGTVGLATATLRNHSSDMLSRIGGRALAHEGRDFQPYYEPKYGCEIQLMRFDSWVYEPRYAAIVENLCAELSDTPVISVEATLPVAVHPAVYAQSDRLRVNAAAA
jgi:hypothetical protein